MATIAGNPSTGPSGWDRSVSFLGVGWAGYRHLLKARGGRATPRMTYLDGNVTVVSPALPHERPKWRIGYFIDELIVGLAIPCFQAGQTTFRRRAKRVGVEADHAYYIANEARVRGRMEIDLRVDPPPDLAVEVVNTHAADGAMEVYRRLRVPEVWIFDEPTFRILARRANGRYVESPSSLAFPALAAAEVADWLNRPYDGPDTAWMRDVRRWVDEVLAPRFRARGE